ncbi:trypsin-like peptidase domain-containing protein [Bremerella sp. P1]|uniref:trypsin-like peptidase domain-containing protein n=1 Tax=Bremerella sp. P1 TaxID=3026424 RepID=UPI0023689C6C|nr:trypsin-like peptidase domain-containing protein [Bremerella sp. P1]WDI42252.1 trypsin-like peptidase domain-containing protein [Bremerella sp. P1]
MRSPSLNNLAVRLCWLLLATAVCYSPVFSGQSAHATELRMTPIVKAVQGAKDAIVNIHGHKTVSTVSAVGGDTPRQVNGMGTGVIIDRRGFIVTNHHVVDGVRRIQVTFNNGETLIARLIAHDLTTDLAVIKVDASKDLPCINIGKSTDLMPGETVIAVGNAYGYENSVTRGIISALHRSVQVTENQKYDDLIQTDASINPGNSGGPLLNIDGQMIGINVAVRVGAQGIGFAIPVDNVMEISSRMMSTERMSDQSHGIRGKTMWEGDTPVFKVTGVEKDSPADAAGLRIGDTLTKIGEQSIQRQLDVELALLNRTLNEEVTLEVDRAGETGKQLAIVTKSVSGATNVSDLAWRTMGVRVKPMPENDFAQLSSRYRGGLQVTAVRAGSPAEVEGIQTGDILVGMHDWETISYENLDYILKNKSVTTRGAIRFYILRERDTLYGDISLAATQQVTQR